MARCTLYFNFDASCLNAYCDFGILYSCRLARKYSIDYLKSIDFTPFDTYPVSISVNFVTYITMNISLQSILNFYQLHIFRIFFLSNFSNFKKKSQVVRRNIYSENIVKLVRICTHHELHSTFIECFVTRKLRDI